MLIINNKYKLSNKSEKIIKTYNTDKKKIIIIKGENTHKVYKIYLRGNKWLEYKMKLEVIVTLKELNFLKFQNYTIT